MAYRVLYREWRPQDFASLVGQEHISRTLQNSVKKERIAHAYLFSGPRGTGKTSTAKILAKAVNCQNQQAGEPCNKCNNCISITEGRSMDVIEIDAASNRGIDEIRDLRERVNYVPTQGKFKVYIIDEVHMLTTEAFNALLKTLEEPPSHILFILATTEPQRLPSTILSRCQRFDFRKISPIEMEKRLKLILEALGIKAEEAVLTLIVRKADGALRDAISILDQCISFSQEQITLQTAYEVLGIVKSDALIALLQAYIEKDAPNLLLRVNMMLKEGLEPGQIIKDLLEQLRNMILLMVCGLESQLVLGIKAEKEVLLKQAQSLGMSWLSNAVTILAKIDSESRWRQNMRIVLETTLLGLLLQENEPAIMVNKEKKNPDLSQKQTALKRAVKETMTSAPPEKVADNIESISIESINIETVKAGWEKVMEAIRDKKKTLYAFLTASEPRAVKKETLLLVFKEGYGFHKEKVEELDNKKLVEEALYNTLGVKLGIECRIEDNANADEDPVQKALKMFGSQIVTITD